MAKTKTTARKKAPRAKTARTRRQSHKIPSWQAALAALPASYEEKINRPVDDLLFDARNLRKVAAKQWSKLVKQSLLSRDALSQLKNKATHLEHAEDTWNELRQRRTPAQLVKLREKGHTLRSDTVAALRYFLSDDSEVQARVAEIVEGDGDADLIDDLRKLASLVSEHKALLTKAALPKRGADALRTLAEAIGDAVSERASDVDSVRALALRNRAFWALREVVSAVRAAGRYVFRKEPHTAAKFVDPFGGKTAPKGHAKAPSDDTSGH